MEECAIPGCCLFLGILGGRPCCLAKPLLILKQPKVGRDREHVVARKKIQHWQAGGSAVAAGGGEDVRKPPLQSWLLGLALGCCLSEAEEISGQRKARQAQARIAASMISRCDDGHHGPLATCDVT